MAILLRIISQNLIEVKFIYFRMCVEGKKHMNVLLQ